MHKYLLFILLSPFTSFGQADCPDTLRPIHVPCCISGMEWSEEDRTLLLVSDLQNKVFKAVLDAPAQTVRVYDSISIHAAPHHKGLEAIRKRGNTFYFSFEKDEYESGERKARAFVSKGRFLKDGKIGIVKSIEYGKLPNNKGIEALTLSPDGNSIWVAHESMARPKNGMDSVLFLQLDTNLQTISSHWYPLWSKDHFEGNTPAYDDYGVTEALYLKDSLYVLERGWGMKEGKGELFLTMSKTSVHNFQNPTVHHVFSSKTSKKGCIDNFEGMCFIPSLGKLLIVSDDNNQKRIQKTIFRLLPP